VHGKRLPATENYRLIPYICSGIALAHLIIDDRLREAYR
jgi:hypothetical protein